MPKQTFAARLRELREKVGLTQEELADRAGLRRGGVAKLEQGLREPTWSTVEALAQALGVDCKAFEGTSTPPGGESAPPPRRPPGRPRKPAEQPPAEPGKGKRRRKGEG